jgi:hypothetical protein
MDISCWVYLFFVFVLAIFLGVELISKVPSQLHTPLMSGSNAISGITIVGALVAAGLRTTARGHHRTGRRRRRGGDDQRGGRLSRDRPHAGMFKRKDAGGGG